MAFLKLRRVSVIPLLGIGITIGLGLAWLIRQPDLDERASTFVAIFQGTFIEAAPFLLLGTVASGLVEEFLSESTVRRFIPQRMMASVLVGSVLGLVLPVGEYGNVPVVRQLLRKGMPLPAVISLLLAAPVINPIVLVSTAAAFGWGAILLLRAGLTAFIAVTTGLVFSLESQPNRLLKLQTISPMQGESRILDRKTPGKRLSRALETTAKEFIEFGQYLILGSLLAALLQIVVPQSKLLAGGIEPLLSVLGMLALSVILSVSSTGDAFVALALGGTFRQGSLIAFLTFGSMADIKSTLMYLAVFQRKTVAYLILIPLVLNLLAGVFINLFL
jgi:uncharacterized membrane protein YraQ (UPF0718 family)